MKARIYSRTSIVSGRYWCRDGFRVVSQWSDVAYWRMGLLSPEDWLGEFIATDNRVILEEGFEGLHLPPASLLPQSTYTPVASNKR